MTVGQFLRGPETMQRRELLVGEVREPPAPFWTHQAIVTRLTVLLDTHVRARGLGSVCVAPVDVVLSSAPPLVVQPDILFVSNERVSIIRRQVWGAPDLVVEVLSTATERRDRTMKVRWYRKYGVRECWLVSVRDQRIEVLTFLGSKTVRRRYRGGTALVSVVLPDVGISPFAVFDT
jgi:Uma2 family endonuclease